LCSVFMCLCKRFYSPSCKKLIPSSFKLVSESEVREEAAD